MIFESAFKLKQQTPRRKKRQSKVVNNEVGEEACNTEGQTEAVCSSGQIAGTEEDAPTESTATIQEEMIQDEQDSPIDCVIEVKGSTPTVSVSWEKENEEVEGDDSERRRRTDLSDQMTAEAMIDSGEQTQAVSSAEVIETKMEQETENVIDKQDSQMDIGNDSTVTVTGTNKPEEGQSSPVKQESNGVSGKRKAPSNTETSPPKKTKLINDGFCLYVGNLNSSKTFEEVKDSLATYFMTQSLLFHDIRLDRSKKHAFVDLASEMDLTKGLTLNGQTILDKPMKIAKAKVKSADTVKAPQDKKAVKDARCLFLKNLPYDATKEDILKIFNNAIDVRFPGGTEGPSQGIAFVEFKKESIAKKVQQKKQGAKIEGRVLVVDFVGETKENKVTKANDDDGKEKAAAPPNNTLFVSNLSYNVKEKKLNQVFQKAVSIKIPQNKGKSKGFAFVEFATVTDAEKALQTTHNLVICKREIRVQFFEMRERPEKVKSKTLIVRSLSEKTTAETLKSAFEGAVDARVAVDKGTGASRKFGFVEFESEENCIVVREAMEDCEIDGSKVTVGYAVPKAKKARGGSAGRTSGQPAGRGAGRGGPGNRGRGGSGSKGGRGRGAGTSRDAVKKSGK
ncbi:nucleolin isoform X1 [Scophthalmus maximus]|uniref:nucleolin isoform X1 n=1 Tax=Scophthalmus maximus TaxID=52904 RepID=UPI001FA83FEF|nr:nucleolin isoform X1 [Scophthalmus maximus]